MSRLCALFRRFRSAERGSVAIIFGLALIPLIIAAGVAVDMGRIYSVKQRLGQAADAAGLAVAASYSTADDLQALLDEYFGANFPASKLGTPATPSYSTNGNIITVSASATVDMTFMKIVGIDDVTVSASSEVTYQEKGVEVVMVLDNTGSMGGSKLSSLKTAANDLVDILFGTKDTPSNVKIGLVPFAGKVNIGSDMTAYTSDPDDQNWGTFSWEGCVEARTYPHDVEDTSIAAGGVWTPFNWQNDDYNPWTLWWWGYGPNRYCPAKVTPLTNDKDTLTEAIDDMVANGYTHINIGAIWGLRLISPDEPFTEGVAYGADGWTKVVIILTDGYNTADTRVKTAYGYPSDEVLGTSSTSSMAAIFDDRLTEICTNIKAEGITVYTITFDLSEASVQAMMEGCATDSTKYYDSPGESELKRTFRAIAAELKKVHLSG